MADISSMIRKAFQQAIEAEGQRLLEQAYQMRPIVTDCSMFVPSDAYAAFTEYGKPHDDLANTIDSTAIVIDENVKALPAPQSETHS